MAIGDQNDFAARIRGVMPQRWFPDTTPVLDGLLAGLGAMWAAVYALYAQAVVQTRILTATDIWLDLVALDFFGTGLTRNPGELDASLRSRIEIRLLRQAVTRGAIIAGLQTLTGRTAIIIEPARVADCGAWDCGLNAWDTAGAWGDLCDPYQMFIQVFRPIGGGVLDATIYATINDLKPAGTIAWVAISN